MSEGGLHIRLKDTSDRTLVLKMDDAEIGEMTFAVPSAHASTVLLSDGRRIELSRDGEGFQGYIANENGRRRAFMVLSNIVRSGKVFTRLGTKYLVKLSEEPHSNQGS